MSLLTWHNFGGLVPGDADQGSERVESARLVREDEKMKVDAETAEEKKHHKRSCQTRRP